MAYTNDQLLALQAALADPTQEVMFMGRRTVFRSVDEIRKAIADVQAGISSQSSRRVRTVKTYQNDENDGTL